MEEYVENAPLMKIDSTAINEIDIYVSEIADRNELRNFVESGKVFDGYEYDYHLYTLLDLITWEDGTQNDSAKIKIQYYEEAECIKIAEFCRERMEEFDETSEVLVGSPYIVVDYYPAEAQSWYKGRISDLKGQLEYARAGYVIETSLPMAMVVGIVTGGFAAIGILLIEYVVEDKRRKGNR